VSELFKYIYFLFKMGRSCLRNRYPGRQDGDHWRGRRRHSTDRHEALRQDWENSR